MHPDLFTIPLANWTVHSYPVLLLLGFTVALFISGQLAKGQGRFEAEVYAYSVWGLFCGVIGSWVLFVLVNYQQLLVDEPIILLGSGVRFPACLAIWRGGAHYVGGFIGAIVAALVFANRRRLPTAELFDALVVGVPLAMIFARIGCIAQGCCFGAPVGWLPFGMVYGAQTHPYRALAGEGYKMAAGHTPLLFPVELAEGLGSILIFVALLYVRRRKHVPGQVFTAYIFLYSLLRFALEWVRGDTERGIWLGGLMSTSQIICFVGLAVSMGWWFFKRPSVALS